MSYCNPDSLVVLTRDYRVMSASSAAGDLVGHCPGPGETFVLEQVFAGEGLENARQAVREALEHGRSTPTCRAHLLQAGGEPIPCDYSVQPVFRGGAEVIGVLLRFRDARQVKGDPVTPRSNGGGLSFLPRVDFQSLYEELPEGVFTVDGKKRITSFNRAAEGITGFTKQEAIGRHCREIFRSESCYADCPLETALQSGRPCLDRDIQILRQDGDPCAISVNVNVLRDERGNIQGAVETFQAADPAYRPSVLGVRKSPAPEFVGQGPEIRRLLAMLPSIAASEANVLICGETGTGKDLLANAIHKLSTPGTSPLVAVNCAALAAGLLESELFGHERGAFTGAERAKPGRLELAAGGTLFLDEIGELQPNLQVKLLRVLEQREFERVGGTRSLPFTARVISATNQDLSQRMQKGLFRKDLYFRLRTVALHLPPLRDRRDDIPLLVDHFIRCFNERYQKRVRMVDPKVMRIFRRYPWPGNVRELERVLEHAFVFVKGPVIFPNYLPELEEVTPTGDTRPPVSGGKDQAAIRWALAQTGGNRRQAAALLGISRTSMWRRMKELGL